MSMRTGLLCVRAYAVRALRLVEPQTQRIGTRNLRPSAGEVQLLRNFVSSLRLPVPFSDWALLKRAMTHPSWAMARAESHNKALEFLGDRVIGVAVSKAILGSSLSSGPVSSSSFRWPVDASAQELLDFSVDNATLSECARSIQLDTVLRRVLDRSGSSERGLDSALGDAFEALVGALYVSLGYEVASTFINRVVLAPDYITDANLALKLSPAHAIMRELRLLTGSLHPLNVEFRTLQRNYRQRHEPQFHVGVFVKDVCVGLGQGGSVRHAQEAAALGALESMDSPLGRQRTTHIDATTKRTGDSIATLRLLQSLGAVNFVRDDGMSAAQARSIVSKLRKDRLCGAPTSSYTRIWKKAHATDIVVGRVFVDERALGNALVESQAAPDEEAAIQLSRKMAEYLKAVGVYSPVERCIARTIGDRSIRLWAANDVTGRRNYSCRRSEVVALQLEYVALISNRSQRCSRAVRGGLKLSPSSGNQRMRRSADALSRAYGILVGLVLQEYGLERSQRLIRWTTEAT
eukprot:Plantae.Rhodophyta-Rhodochaete_pulchella.ctg2693.p1 GENE.Plantae.Rhodophyta-Rhodochaete_pulchella.ctg2693~~Plantae.Rhodophyta-Rhodochaete_pulchella.ctg2693.p1  ORF type:complete len:520 (-),score=38.03 Plantae.Rhodophyta-Rhodochaete_pulchella.ctg2693:757-2316(-)